MGVENVSTNRNLNVATEDLRLIELLDKAKALTISSEELDELIETLERRREMHRERNEIDKSILAGLLLLFAYGVKAKLTFKDQHF